MAYEYESKETRVLKTIDSKRYPDTNKDFVKNVTRLNSSVDYISSYMRIMQKGIDDANKSFIEQIQSFINDLIVLFAGGEPTGIELGDLKYIIQAIGALFGFSGPFPINLINAVVHFFQGFLGGLIQLSDLIFDAIEAWMLDLIDKAGDIPIIGDAITTFANWIIDSTNGIQQAIDDAADAFAHAQEIIDTFLRAMGLPTWSDVEIWFDNLWNGMLFGIDFQNFDIVQAATAFINNFLTGTVNLLATLSNGFLSVFQIPGLDASKIVSGQFAQSFVTGLTGALTTLGNGINQTINDLGQLLYDLWHDPIKVISNLLAAMIPGLDASKIISGLFGTSQINGLDGMLSALANGLNTVNKLVNDFFDALEGAFRGVPVIGAGIASVIDGIQGFWNSIFGVPRPMPTLASKAIPALDASKIQTGQLTDERIANLNAAKIDTGTLSTGVIPSLDASKVTTGTLAPAVVPDITSGMSSGIRATNTAIYNGYFQSGGSGTVAEAQAAIAAIKTQITKGYTLESLTYNSGTSGVGTWTRPWTLSDPPKEFYAIVFGGGGGGGNGQSVVTQTLAANAAGGVGGSPGGYAAMEIDASICPSTVYYRIGAGGIGSTSTSTNAATPGSETVFGGYTVTSLINAVGTNGLKTIPDIGTPTSTWDSYGTAQLSTAQTKFDGGSLSFDGTTDCYMSRAAGQQMGSGDFTIEMWVRPTAYPASGSFGGLYSHQSILNYGGWENLAHTILLTDVGAIYYGLNSGNTSAARKDMGSAAGTVPLNQWTHLAIVRSGSTITMYINGTAQTSVAVSTLAINTFTVGAGIELLGAYQDASTGFKPYSGFIDEVRITKGLARYTSNFTTPTASPIDDSINLASVSGRYSVANLLGYYSTSESAPGAGGAGGAAVYNTGYTYIYDGASGGNSLLASGGRGGGARIGYFRGYADGNSLKYPADSLISFSVGQSGSAGGKSTLTGKSRAGGGGGGGGGCSGTTYKSGTKPTGGYGDNTSPGGLGANGGFPGGGGGGGGAGYTYDRYTLYPAGLAGGNGGNGANGVIILLWK